MWGGGGITEIWDHETIFDTAICIDVSVSLSCISVLMVSILPLSSFFLLDFMTFQYVFVFPFVTGRGCALFHPQLMQDTTKSYEYISLL